MGGELWALDIPLVSVVCVLRLNCNIIEFCFSSLLHVTFNWRNVHGIRCVHVHIQLC